MLSLLTDACSWMSEPPSADPAGHNSRPSASLISRFTPRGSRMGLGNDMTMLTVLFHVSETSGICMFAAQSRQPRTLESHTRLSGQSTIHECTTTCYSVIARASRSTRAYHPDHRVGLAVDIKLAGSLSLAISVPNIFMGLWRFHRKQRLTSSRQAIQQSGK